MEQNHFVLINRFFSGSTEDSGVSSKSLKYSNKYFSNSSGNEIKIVDFSNIRSFLANKNNQKAVESYYAFLTASSSMNSAILINPYSNDFIPTAQFKAIYYDDEKLAESFNNFYNSSIIRGIDSSYSSNPNVFNTSVKNLLTENDKTYFVTQKVFHNYYLWQSNNPSFQAYSPKKEPILNAVLDIYNGERDETLEEKYLEVSSEEESYYLNVFLTKRFTQISRSTFEACENIIYKSLKYAVQFSQNPINIINYGGFLNSYESNSSSLNNSSISTDNNSTINVNVFSKGTPPPEVITTDIKPSLIQCFVDPNFKFNEDEYWSDNKF